MKKTLHLEGLDCPVCAEALQSDLQKIKGVISVSVDYPTQTISLEVKEESAIGRVIAKANKFEKVRVLEGNMKIKPRINHLKEWILIGISALFLVVGIIIESVTSSLPWRITYCVVYALGYLAVGSPVWIATVKNLCKGRFFDENFLMSLASVVAIALGEFREGVLVMLLYQLGELLQAIAVGNSRKSVTKLLELKTEYAVRIDGEEQTKVSPEKLEVGEILLVKAGERVPVDGVVLTENAFLDTKSLTGEAEIRAYTAGEEVLSGCINAGAAFTMRVARPYAESAVGRILEMVENASKGKAKPEKFIAKFAKIYTPAVCLFAVLLATLAPFVSGLLSDGRWYFKDGLEWLHSALTFLVISCPCALVISVPLTYFSGVGACAKNGILVKGAVYLDIVAKARIAAFDKTGTLTEGDFSVLSVHVKKGTEEELLSIVSALEKSSSHPITSAFNGYQTDLKAEAVREVGGEGLIGVIDGEKVLVGSKNLLEKHGVQTMELHGTHTLVYVAKKDEMLGVIELGDKLRGDAAEMIISLKRQGISKCVMLTGDGEKRAKKVAEEVGLTSVYASLLPDEKLEKARELKKDGVLLYVGDGVNDAPVMVEADCAVSMGKLGSAAAVEASDFVLVFDELSSLIKTLKIAKKTRKIVLQNIVFSILMKVAFMALGTVGILPLSLAVFADVGVMLLAVCNSFRVRGKIR